MDSIYWIIITALLLLAAFDLINGVANDAVNFLNSAIGSKAAPVRVILTVASIGVLVGACFSGGMMEVARNGIFHPDMFSYHEVMLLFLGVMISEVILLDTFFRIAYVHHRFSGIRYFGVCRSDGPVQDFQAPPGSVRVGFH